MLCIIELDFFILLTRSASSSIACGCIHNGHLGACSKLEGVHVVGLNFFIVFHFILGLRLRGLTVIISVVVVEWWLHHKATIIILIWIVWIHGGILLKLQVVKWKLIFRQQIFIRRGWQIVVNTFDRDSVKIWFWNYSFYDSFVLYGHGRSKCTFH